MNTNNKTTELPEGFKDLSLKKMLKHYEFICQNNELTERELKGKKILEECIEISLKQNQEWCSLLLFTHDEQIISVCQEKIDVNAIVDEIFNQPISKLSKCFRTFFFNPFNFN